MFDHSWYIFLEIPTYLGFRNIYYKSKCFLVVRYEGHCSIFYNNHQRVHVGHLILGSQQ